VGNALAVSQNALWKAIYTKQQSLAVAWVSGSNILEMESGVWRKFYLFLF
jgi:hypothetical protein